MAVSTISTASLLLQAAVLVLLVYGLYLMRGRKDLPKHGLVLVAAVVLNLLTVVLFMLPSWSGDVSSPALDRLPWLLPLHHIIGLIAIAMTLAVVLPWLLRKRSPRACPGGTKHRRVLMRATFGMFFLSIVLGFVVYLALV
jgi:uncharacterized membrane protein YozB (DUF420 family)